MANTIQMDILPCPDWVRRFLRLSSTSNLECPTNV